MRTACSMPGSNSNSRSGVRRRLRARPISRLINPCALLKPASAAAARVLPSRCEKKTRPCRRSSSIWTRVRLMPRSRGSLSARISSSDNSRSTSSETRSALFTSAISEVNDLQLLFAQGREAESVDKIHDFAQGRIDKRAIVTGLANPQLRALPHIVFIGLGDRHVKLVSHPCLDCSQHLALSLERMIFREKQGNPHYAAHHGAPP